MADNTVINAGSGGDTIGTDDVSAVKYQVVKVAFGADGAMTRVTATAPMPAFAPDTIQAVAISTSTGTQSVSCYGSSTIGVVLTSLGTGGNVVFEQSVDGTNWAAARAFPFGGGAPVASANAAGSWLINAGGCAAVRLRATALTSGTIAGTLRATGAVGIVPISDNADSVTVDGTVTANIGSSGSLALDATLTGGTAKAIVRGGAKGSTTAADVTSTAEGTDHQAVDVQIYHGGTAKDPTAIRALTSADVVTIGAGDVDDGASNTAKTVQIGGNASDVTVYPSVHSASQRARVWVDLYGRLVTTRSRAPTYMAVFKTAGSNDPALSTTLTASTWTCVASMMHDTTATKNVRVRRVEVDILSNSVAGVLAVQLDYAFTTLAAGGNPAITPAHPNPGTGAAELTCLANPTTKPTLLTNAPIACKRLNLGVTSATAETAQPITVDQTILLYDDSAVTEETDFLGIRAGSKEGYSISMFNTGTSSVVKWIARAWFTEQ